MKTYIYIYTYLYYLFLIKLYYKNLKKKIFLQLCQNMKIASKKQDIDFTNAKLNFIFAK